MNTNTWDYLQIKMVMISKKCREVSGVFCGRNVSVKLKGMALQTAMKPTMLYGIKTPS